MALLGTAAMLLWFDIAPDQIAEHDDWHTREHFPERVSIPGFIRAQRWISRSPGTRYHIVYEVTDIDVLSSPSYLERLNNPTPWTRRMMPSYQAMVRAFCQLESSHGSVLGTSCLSLRYGAAKGMEGRLRDWLDLELIPGLMRRRGVTSAFMFRSDRAPEMTTEQRIRGRDAGGDLALMVTGYSPDLVAELATNELGAHALESHGALPRPVSGVFQLACMATACG